jgi:hypothetical protein
MFTGIDLGFFAILVGCEPGKNTLLKICHIQEYVEA